MHRRRLVRLLLTGLPVLGGCALTPPPVPTLAPTATVAPTAPPTATPAPAPSATPTPPPSATPPPPTATPAPTATRAPSPTPVPPTATPTRVPPTATRRPPTAVPTAAPPPRPTATTAAPAPPPQPPPAGVAREIVRGDPTVPAVALTLDAGAGAAPAAAMLATLAEKRLHTTFFLTGRWCEQNPALVRQIHAAGHEISNHSYSHPDFRTIDDARIAEEITRTEQIIVGLTGASSKPWFRFPYGARDARTRAAVDRLGYTSVFWTLDSLDSVGEIKTPAFLRERVVGKADNGAIVLMHIGSAPTAAALPEIIDGLRDRGLRLVTLSALVR